jgi:hypothetical protein
VTTCYPILIQLFLFVTDKSQSAGNKLLSEPSGTQTGAAAANDNIIQQNGNLPKAPQPKKPEIANGLPPNAVRQAASNPLDTSSPARRDGHSAVSALLKEGRDLKHTADRMKVIRVYSLRYYSLCLHIT